MLQAEAGQPSKGTLSLLESVHALLGELPGLVSDRVHLFALELTRSSQALGRMLFLTLFAVILAGTCWVTLCAGLALAIHQMGVHWAMVLAAIVIVNAALAYVIFRRVLMLSSLLHMPATLRHLTLASPHLPAHAAEALNTANTAGSHGQV